MTRQEFINDVNDFCDLKEFCRDYDLNLCDDVYSEDEYDEIVDEEMLDEARNEHWWEVRTWINNLPSGYDWYFRGDYEWEAADFEAFKADVLDYMDYREAWDDEEVELLDDIEVRSDSAPEEEPEVLSEVFFAVLAPAC